jgi:serine/threonine protein kinase
MSSRPDDETPSRVATLTPGTRLGPYEVLGPLGAGGMGELAAQAASALARAHADGIVHRDLKPENLMLSRDGYLKILDFGLAKLVETERAGSGSEVATAVSGTQAGTVLGTVGYMSPEQAAGRAVDFRSDQFSLGTILSASRLSSV